MWIECDDADSSVVSFIRRSKEKELIFVCNFTPVVHKGFHLGVPKEGVYQEIFNSDAERFGGSNVVNEAPMESTTAPCNRCQFSVNVDVPPLGMIVLERKAPVKIPAKLPVKKESAVKKTKKSAAKTDLA